MLCSTAYQGMSPYAQIWDHASRLASLPPHQYSHTWYLSPNQDQDVTYLVPVVIISFRHPQCSRIPSPVLLFCMQKFDVALPSIVFHIHIGIVWMMSALAIWQSKYTPSTAHSRCWWVHHQFSHQIMRTDL